jgi:hypothetical protein
MGCEGLARAAMAMNNSRSRLLFQFVVPALLEIGLRALPDTLYGPFCQKQMFSGIPSNSVA